MSATNHESRVRNKSAILLIVFALIAFQLHREYQALTGRWWCEGDHSIFMSVYRFPVFERIFCEAPWITWIATASNFLAAFFSIFRYRQLKTIWWYVIFPSITLIATALATLVIPTFYH